MKSNPMKNRSARERAHRRNMELLKQEEKKLQDAKDTKSTMWVLTIGFMALSLLLLASAAVNGLDWNESVPYFIIAGVMALYSVPSLIVCRKYNITGINFQLSTMLFNTILMVAGTLFFVLR